MAPLYWTQPLVSGFYNYATSLYLILAILNKIPQK